jgi:hypothetical protein
VHAADKAMKLPEISSLIDLASLAASQGDESPDISTCSNYLLKALSKLQACRAGLTTALFGVVLLKRGASTQTNPQHESPW